MREKGKKGKKERKERKEERKEVKEEGICVKDQYRYIIIEELYTLHFT